MTSHTNDDTKVLSKHKAYTFSLRDINDKLESQNALLMLEADDKGELINACILDKEGFNAEVHTVDVSS